MIQFQFVSECRRNEQFFLSFSVGVDIIFIDVLGGENGEIGSTVSDFKHRLAHGLGVCDHVSL